MWDRWSDINIQSQTQQNPVVGFERLGKAIVGVESGVVKHPRGDEIVGHLMLNATGIGFLVAANVKVQFLHGLVFDKG